MKKINLYLEKLPRARIEVKVNGSIKAINLGEVYLHTKPHIHAEDVKFITLPYDLSIATDSEIYKACTLCCAGTCEVGKGDVFL